MGLSWQQGPLSPTSNGTFLVPDEASTVMRLYRIASDD